MHKKVFWGNRGQSGGCPAASARPDGTEGGLWQNRGGGIAKTGTFLL